MTNNELTSLKGFPKLPNLRKVCRRISDLADWKYTIQFAWYPLQISVTQLYLLLQLGAIFIYLLWHRTWVYKATLVYFTAKYKILWVSVDKNDTVKLSVNFASGRLVAVLRNGLWLDILVYIFSYFHVRCNFDVAFTYFKHCKIYICGRLSFKLCRKLLCFIWHCVAVGFEWQQNSQRSRRADWLPRTRAHQFKRQPDQRVDHSWTTGE